MGRNIWPHTSASDNRPKGDGQTNRGIQKYPNISQKNLNTWKRAKTAYTKILPRITEWIQSVRTQNELSKEYKALTKDLLSLWEQSPRRRMPNKRRKFGTTQLQQMDKHRKNCIEKPEQTGQWHRLGKVPPSRQIWREARRAKRRHFRIFAQLSWLVSSLWNVLGR